MSTSLSFEVSRIVFQKEGFSIVGTSEGASASGNFAAKVGYSYTAQGQWDTTSSNAVRYGPTFKISSIEQQDMLAARALCKYLIHSYKGAGKGIGKVFLESLAAAVIEDDLCLATLLSEGAQEELVDLVGKRNAKKVAQLILDWPDLKPEADLKTPLLNLGLSDSQSQELIEEHGKNALKVIEKNPYGLILDLHQISFRRADLIAKKVKAIDSDDPVRIAAAFYTALEELTSNGSLGVRRSRLIHQVRLLLNETILVDNRRMLDPSVPIALDTAQLDSILDQFTLGKSEKSQQLFVQNLVALPDEKGNELIWLASLIEAEDIVARKLSSLNASSLSHLIPSMRVDIEKSGVTLAPAQLEAIEMVLSHPVSIITGGPGCGKSFILMQILSVLKKAGLKGALAAPTGIAARRMAEATGSMAQTIHSLLGVRGGAFEFDEINPLPYDFIVIDEASMVDIRLMSWLLRAVTPNTIVIFIGDVDQLPSVGPGQVLRDLIRSKCIPVTYLTYGWRFSGGIAEAADKVKRGEFPTSSEDGQFVYIDSSSPHLEVSNEFDKLMSNNTNVDNIQLLSPTHKGQAGCSNLNAIVQAKVNPFSQNSSESHRIAFDFHSIFVNDRALFTVNSLALGLVNGDIGYIENIESASGKVSYGVVGQDTPVELSRSDARKLQLAYAITIHKSQGSEAPVIIIVVDASASYMLSRNLLYTAITRGAEKVILIASSSLIARGLSKKEPEEGSRASLLCSKIIHLMSPLIIEEVKSEPELEFMDI